MFPDFLTPALTQLFFQKPLTTLLTCFCSGERRKYAGKKVHLNQGSNSQPLGHESDMLTTEPPGRDPGRLKYKYLPYHPLPNNKILELSKLKAFVNNEPNVNYYKVVKGQLVDPM